MASILSRISEFFNNKKILKESKKYKIPAVIYDATKKAEYEAQVAAMKEDNPITLDTVRRLTTAIREKNVQANLEAVSPIEATASMREAVKSLAVEKARSEYAYAPTSVTDPMYERYKEDPVIVKLFEDVVVDGQVTHRLRVKDFEELSIEEAVQVSRNTKSNIRNFFNQMKEFADKQKLDPTKENNAWVFSEFISDYTDDYRIAENFAEPGSELERYSRYADVPVPVIALHSILSNGSIKLNKDGTVNKVSFKNLVKNLGNDKMVEFASELCGLKIDENGKAVERTPDQYEFPERADFFKSLLPVASEFFNEYSENYKLFAMMTKEELKAKMDEIHQTCAGYTNQALENDDISEQVYEDAERASQYVSDDTISAVEAKRIALAVNEIGNDLNSGIVADVASKDRDDYKLLHKQLEETFKGSALLSDDVYKKIIDNSMPKFKDLKSVDVNIEYADLLAMIVDNNMTISAIQQVIADRNNGVMPELTPEQLETTGLKGLVDFSQNIIELIKMKERARGLAHTVGQIKYEGLVVSDAIVRQQKKEIVAQRETELKGLRKELSAINRTINTEKLETERTTNTRAIEINEYYGLRFEETIRDYIAVQFGNRAQENEKFYATLQKQIKLARQKIERTNGDATEAQEEFQRQFVMIAKGIGRFKYSDMAKKGRIVMDDALKIIEDSLIKEDRGASMGLVNTTLDTINGELTGEIEPNTPAAKGKLQRIKTLGEKSKTASTKLTEAEEKKKELDGKIDSFDGETQKIIDAKVKEINELNGRAVQGAISLEYQQTQSRIEEAKKALSELEKLQAVPPQAGEKRAKAYSKTYEDTKATYESIIEDGNKKLASIQAQATKLGLVQSVDQENGNVMFVPKNPESEAVEETTEIESTNNQTPQEKETQAEQTTEQTTEQTQVIPKELQEEAERFVTAYVSAAALNAVYNDPRSEMAQEVMSMIDFAKLYPNRENGYEAGRESATKVIEDCNDIMENIARKKQPVGPEDHKAFIKVVATEFIKQQKKGLEQSENPDPNRVLTQEEAEKQFGAELARLQGRKVEATDAQHLDADIVAHENPDAQATETKEGETKKPKSKKPVKIEYTVKGCELALKSINKMLAKLEEQIKKDKALAAEAKARAAALEKEAQSQDAQAPKNETTLDPQQKPVEEEQTETTSDSGERSSETIEDISELFIQETPNTPAKAAAKQVYLTMVYEEMAKTLKGMDNISAAELMKSLDISIDGIDFANATPEQIVEALEQKGISLDTQNRAFSVQLSTIKNAQVNKEGHLVNAKGQDVETKLYERFDDAKEAISTGISGGKKGQTTVRNLILYAVGKDLIDRQKVEEESNKIVKALEDNGIEVTPEQIGKVLSGELKLADGTPVVDITTLRSEINTKLESKVPKKDMGSK